VVVVVVVMVVVVVVTGEGGGGGCGGLMDLQTSAATVSSQEYVELCSRPTISLNGTALYLQGDFRHLLAMDTTVLGHRITEEALAQV
jgi:hypothetical protein